MQCPNCQHHNKPSAKFCSNCGSKLQKVCPNCGTQVEPADRFCSECATPLDTPITANQYNGKISSDPLSYTPEHLARKILKKRRLIEGERRTITVLFADAKGFTPISERIGEEKIYDISKTFIDLMVDSVHRYEGTINQFRGDGILALFGAPMAHEDSARRAVAAALEMKNTLKKYTDSIKTKHGINLQFRIGLNTGPVVVGKIHDNLEMDFTAYGDTVNLGARMEEMAEPGMVYLSEHTYRVVSNYYECESLGARKVKGKENPVIIYRAIRPKHIRTRFEAASERGLTPFVGRKHELTVLLEYIEKVKKGKGQVMLISSEAGTGKSRLLLEFKKAIHGHEVNWLEGRCISFGQNISYLPFIDIIRNTFRVEEDDKNDDINERIEEKIAQWDRPSKDYVPYLKFLMHVDPGDSGVVKMDPMERRVGIIDGLRTIFIEESRERPLVVVVEDLHWIDEPSESALKALVDVVATVPVLLILTYRPDYNHVFGERTFFSRLSLGNLHPEEGAELATGMLQVSDLPEDLHQFITRKGEGNPFYIEEVIFSLLESGVLKKTNGTFTLQRPVDQIRVPDTIHEVILSRIDRLEHEAREAIQLASVIGREFTYRLLDRISDEEVKLEERLEELKVLELIHHKEYFPELSYMFKHALTQDVAYSTLLQQRRKVLHGIIGSAIEKLYWERLAEHYEVLAYHYFEGEVWEKAFEYSLKSAKKSVAAFANQDALTYFDRALKAYEMMENTSEEMLIDIYSGRAELYLAMTEFKNAVDNYNILREIGHSIGNYSMEGLALAGAAMAYVWAHDLVKAESVAKEALTLADSTKDDLVRTAVNNVLGFIDAIRGELVNMENRASKVVQLSRKIGDPTFEVLGCVWMNLLQSWRAEYEKAHQYGQMGMKAAERDRSSTFALVQIRWTYALSLIGHGRYNEAITLIKDSISFCERMEEKVNRSRQLNTLGWLYNELCNWKLADQYNQKGLDLALSIGDPEIIINARINLADTAIGMEDIRKARKMLEDMYVSLPDQHEWMKWRYTQHLTHSLGEVHLAEGKLERSLKMVNECLDLAEATDSRKNIIKGRRLSGLVFLAQEEFLEAEKELMIALEIAKQICNPPQLWKTLVALGNLWMAQKNKAKALQAYNEALLVVENIASGLSDKSLKETFLSSKHVKSIIKKAGK